MGKGNHQYRLAADGERVSDAMALALQDALPRGAHVAVHWLDPHGSTGSVASPGAPEALRALAGRLLSEEPESGGPVAPRLELRFDEVDGTRVAIAASVTEPMAPQAQAVFTKLARRSVCASLLAERAQMHAELLRKSERLQQALFEIADLAGSDMDLADMLEHIHRVIAGLMYAENFYIVSYDDARDRMRFLYFVDRRDPFTPDPAQEFGGEESPTSLTLALLRHGASAHGSIEQVRSALGILPADADEAAVMERDNGPESEDWLGVPMRREDRVCGAIVVQSYDRPGSYGEEERALLSFVAQHVRTALDRHQAREELERRVQQRTEALWQSNRDLQAEIIERQRGERLQRTLFRIAELSITCDTLERFYAQVHDIVGELLYARNFYIAMTVDDGTMLEFPYSIDERDFARSKRPRRNGLTEYVIDTGRALLADRARIADLEERGVLRSSGSLACCWLGVPLLRDEEPVGCIAVQSYSPAVMFSARDQELLTFIAHHIGIGLERKQAQDRLLSAHVELEQRVTSRTRELAQANAELVAQISERVRAEQQLTYQALHDTLTGLPNRGQLLKRLGNAIKRAQADASRRFAVLFLDLDRFKLINDSAGHSAGDMLLVEVGRRIVDAVRGHDTVARLGGDEFAVLIEDISGAHIAEELAERVLQALAEPCWIAGREVFPSASVGIAKWHPSYRDGMEMLRDADAAMYRAKAAGRSGWAVFDEAMREEAMRILDLEADLRRAINGTGFVAFYQPIVRLEDRKVIGHEALLRWRHERRGLLLPSEFIGLGADTGLIEEVDWLVYEQVAQRLALGVSGYVSVNVSPRHFRAPDFSNRLMRLLDGAGADPSRLRIEITEVALLDDMPRALRTLQTLRGHGVLAQLDDFGTGFSALSYLHRFPIECLKIDQSFVAGLAGEASPESVAVVRAIQALAGTLDIHTVGEGIETECQRDVLRELGCSHGQGYLFGHSTEVPKTSALA